MKKWQSGNGLKKGLLAGMYEFPNVEGHLRTEEVIGYAQTAGLTPVRVKPDWNGKTYFQPCRMAYDRI